MKRFKALTVALAIMVIFSLSSVTAFADSPDPQIPKEATQEANKTGQPIEFLENGLYSVGDHLFVDVSVYKSADSNLPFIMESSDTFTETPTPFGNRPPDKDSIWDWSQGQYHSNFTVSTRVFTEYRFGGYSSYNVNAWINPYDGVASGNIKLSSYKGNNDLGVSMENSTGELHVTFLNCNPNEYISFCVTKSYDTFFTTGGIIVYGRVE